MCRHNDEDTQLRVQTTGRPEDEYWSAMLRAHSQIFPNYVFTDPATTLDLMVAEIMILRLELGVQTTASPTAVNVPTKMSVRESGSVLADMVTVQTTDDEEFPI